jgi:hypothetical protein
MQSLYNIKNKSLLNLKGISLVRFAGGGGRPGGKPRDLIILKNILNTISNF